MELAYALHLALKTPSNNEVKNMHWVEYRKLRQCFRDLVWVAVNGRLPKTPVSPAFLVITRHSAGSGLDWDNAYGGLKPLLDCLVTASSRNPDGLGFIVDDNVAHMPEPPYVRQVQAQRGLGFTEVHIYAGVPTALPWQALIDSGQLARQP